MAFEYIELHNVKIINPWKNFKGKVSEYNEKGERTYDILIDADMAAELRERGINVKVHPNRDPDSDPAYSIKAVVSFHPVTPDEIARICNGRKKILHEDTIASLDAEDIDHIDVKLSVYNWTRNGRSGKKLYTTKLYAHVNEVKDSFSATYDDMPIMGIESAGDDEECPF